MLYFCVKQHNFLIMSLNFKFLIIICFLGIVNPTFSQEKKSKTDIKAEPVKIYHYKFGGALSSEASENLRNDILKMLFVTEVKVEYKAEKQMGQVKVVTKEHFINNDTDFQFNISGLNELLSKHNLTPIEYFTN